MEEIEVKLRNETTVTQGKEPDSVIDFEADSKATPNDSEIKRLTDLTRLQIKLEDSVLEAEKKVKELNEKLREVSEDDIPALMNEIGQVKEITLTSGEKIKINTDVYASITKAKQSQAFEWLTVHNFDDLIKNSVVIPFDKGENERSAALIDLMDLISDLAQKEKQDIQWTSGERGKVSELIKLIGPKRLLAESIAKIHSQTLKAFVRERLLIEANVKTPDPSHALPQKVFGVYTVDRSKITRVHKRG